jgi:hypothetical protein
MDRWLVGYIDDIGYGHPHGSGKLAQNGDAGVSRSFFDFYQHAFADTRTSRKLIQREFFLFPEGFDPSGYRCAD